jgi:carotenoid cleavage dioxygenase-like enzyme
MSTVTSRFLEGNFAPVAEEVTSFALPVTGELPSELTGRLLRIGPNPMTPPDPATYHWFVGDGMVHGLRLRGGRAEWYRNRWVRGDEVVNTHVVGIGGRTFALVEAGNRPVELTDELETIGSCRFDGTLDGSFTAHPHEDPATGLRHAITYHWSWDHVRHVVLGPDAHVRRELQVPVPGGPSVHDCAITERFVLIFDLPVTFSMDAVAAGARFPYRWDPSHQPRVGLLPLEGQAGDVVWFEAPSCYVFHALNAFDELGDGRDRVVVDVVRHPRMFASVLNGPDEGGSMLERWTLDLPTGRLTTEVLDDRSQEFPRLDERVTGRRHRYGYGATLAPGAHHGPALKHDLAAGTTTEHDYGPGRVTLEPVFVPRPDAVGEDDGWVLSYVYDATSDRSDVVVLDAQDFGGAPVATVHLPVRVPFGFHGSWVPDEG